MEHYYIGSLTKTGNRFKARKLFMNVLYRVKSLSNFNNYSEILFRVYEICAPLVGVRYLKKSGQNYSLPDPISIKRAESVVARWVIQSSLQRSDVYTLEDKLVNEINDILAGKGFTLAKRAEFHKKIVANRFFMKVSFKKPKVVTSFNPYARIVKKVRKFLIILIIFCSMHFFLNSFNTFKKLYRPIHWMSGRSHSGRRSVFSKSYFSIVPRFCYLDLIRKRGSGKVMGLIRMPNKNYYSAVIYSVSVGFYIIVAPQQFESECDIESLSNVFNPGNSIYVGNVPIGYKLYNIASPFESRATYSRAAGCGSLVVSRESKFSLLKLPSGKIKKFSIDSIGSFGIVSLSFNSDKFQKAGSFTKYGRKPTARGVAKNPIDHPHGGGEGKKSKPVSPRSPWGWLTTGYSSIRGLRKVRLKLYNIKNLICLFENVIYLELHLFFFVLPMAQNLQNLIKLR